MNGLTNTTQNQNVSLSVFYSYKPYHLSKPTEKEKTSCLCVDCLNPHLLLKPINNYRKSRNLNVYQSLSRYLNENKSDDDLFRRKKTNYVTTFMNVKLSATKEMMTKTCSIQ